MHRFRWRRRRAIAIALFAFVALIATPALAEAPPGKSARIGASNASVAVGQSVVLRGSFPGASNAPIEIRHRGQGEATWRALARNRTGARGRYSVEVEPRRSGFWRAELVDQPITQGASESEQSSTAESTRIDRGTGSQRIAVRSRTETKVRGRHSRVARVVEVSGKVTPAGARRKVVVSIGEATETTSAGRSGKFRVEWKAPDTGSYPVRVRARPNREATGSSDRAGAVTVYREALASWYGPGLYGNSMACGGTLTPATVGVAHKALPCDTKLRLRYGGRTVSALVVDRGPYAGNREFDLTYATKRALGFPDTSTVLTSK